MTRINFSFLNLGEYLLQLPLFFLQGTNDNKIMLARFLFQPFLGRTGGPGLTTASNVVLIRFLGMICEVVSGQPSDHRVSWKDQDIFRRGVG